MKIDADSLEGAIASLREITDRARAMGIGLAKYPVGDVERVLGVVRLGRLKPAEDAAT